ncbi:MAG: GNAT family N-acetyltransferase [Marinilabiliales bacterium]|nr:MAG: GNAT family N-acetyltransferase [Marinilabiliales bacterium]
MSILENNNVFLRAPEPEDLNILYQWENNTNIWQVSQTLVPFSKYILKKYIENSHLDIYEIKQARFIICSTKEKRPVGAIDIFDFDPANAKAGVGILIGSENDYNKAYASNALQLLIDYCFSVLKLHQLYCNILESNKNSLALFEKYGFKITGKKEDWVKTTNGYENEFLLQLIR